MSQPDMAENARLKEALDVIIGRLQVEADDRVSKRRNVELRWLEDTRQHQGIYQETILADLKNAKKSTLFINETRPKTNSCDARLSDMLFPTDDKNWGIKPTPVPELTNQAKESLTGAKELLDQATAFQGAGDVDQAKQLAGQAQQKYDEAAAAKEVLDEAKKRAKAMETEIEDQLVESSYAIHCRDVIRDACKLGTGILKGPVAAEDRSRRAWEKEEGGAYELTYVADNRAAAFWVDPWGFFPETGAKTIEESESTFERHLYTKKELRQLAKQPGFDKDAIRRVLSEKTPTDTPTYLSELRNITNENLVQDEGRYQAWEYRGPLGEDDLKDVCRCLGEEDVLKNYETDPLEQISVVIWFCEGEVFKFGIHHLDSGESIYSVFNLEKDESSIWGFGVPYILRNPQSALNGAWRMMMDNASLSSRPQIFMDQSVIEPADGEWALLSGKIWLRKADAPANKPGFSIENIDSHQGELQAIIAQTMEVIDSVTNISSIAEGEQGAHTTTTSGGMAMLMNAVNVVFRRMVKNFDDDLSVPTIRRFYDWNMQFSDKEEIKGDYRVDARGSSVLLVREIQSQNLMVLAQMTSHPVIGQLLKGAPIMRKLLQSMMIPADEVVPTDDELKARAEAEANKEPKQTPEMEMKVLEAKSKMDIAMIGQQTALMVLADKLNMTLKELQNKLQLKQMDTDTKVRTKQVEADSKERIFSAEAAMTERLGGETKGGGGYL